MVIDALTSRLLVRRLARNAPPPLPAPLVRSAPFATLVVERDACPELYAAYERILSAAGATPAQRLSANGGERASEAAYTAAAPATLAGVRAALRWAAAEDEESARRLIVSPLSPVAPVDARALIVAAGTRSTIAETLAAQRALLDEEARENGFRFLAMLAALRVAYRAQGARASEVVATLCAEFTLTRADRRVVADAVAIAAALDAVDGLTKTVWDPGEFIAALDDEIRLERLSGTETALPPLRPAPVTPRALPARKGHFSASSLNSFAECRRKWFYRYLCAAVEDRGSAASMYGTAFHNALEGFHKRWPRIAEVEPQLLQRHLEGYVRAAFDRYRDGFDSNVEFELQRRRAVRTGRKYGEWLIARAKEAPFSVVGCEISTELTLDGFDFVGYIDRVDRDERTGGVTVVDYKTGTIATSANEYREKVRNFADFQLPFYYWARTEAGDRVTRLALIPLKEATADVLPIELEVVLVPQPANGRRVDRAITGTITIDELRTARAKMVELCAVISSGTLEAFPATNDPLACRYCVYRPSCRERPPLTEDRFGR